MDINMKKTISHKINTKKSVHYIRNGILSIGLMVLIIFIGTKIFDIFKRKYEIELEKQELLTQVSRIKQDTLSLEQIKEYMSSSAYQEREAKQKLDLKKPGEEVVVITPGSVTANLSDQDLISILRNPKSEERIPAQTNPERWWAFFFDKERL